MPDEWVPRPNRSPHRCWLSATDDPERGPYWDAGRRFRSEDPQDERTYSLFISAAYLRDIMDRDGSPYIAIPRAAYAHDQETLEAQRNHISVLQNRVAELTASLSKATAPVASVDVEELARGLYRRLDEDNVKISAKPRRRRSEEEK